MSLDVSVPDPPPQSQGAPGRGYDNVSPPESDDDDYRRDELESILEAGAWADGFEAWAAETSLGESEFELLVRHGLLEQLDFYWDPATEAVEYHLPQFSDDMREALATDADVDEVKGGLDSLGRTVSERLEREYRT
ncbi:hypothetical protein [Haloarcula onubensis]|uniref:DUF7992 domain-containing protein n=1 Tax=Haloarcula onubensis TaxID=2950539 RepID=A0ABU2FKH6_9EURY|nr:hypothetical protein [Halomicroarcula sp. S3CR25-11]MDS0280762.1 hypothetical protein [Halomicroarcula sp. S3CR25-11]